MSSDEPEGTALPSDATTPMPAGERPGSTLHSYAGGWQPPTVAQMQAMLPQYQFIEMLGAGGMGAVYKAMQVSLDRLVAIKILPPGLEDGSGANFTERFKQEAKTMAKMSHPCIVNVHDFGQTAGGQFYFVMEFIEGTDVQKMIRTNKRLKPDDALAITAHVCDALEYAHNRGVIHRDIKPANVLISAEGTVKIADFGLAKAVDNKLYELTRSNMAMGTPHFMAPETMFADVKVDGRADLYAVGVMLHNMLTGEIPTGRFELPSKKTGCDKRFDQIVDKAMQADRELRYQTATEIRKALDTILTTPVVAEGDDSIAVVVPLEMMRGQPVKVVADSAVAPAQKPKKDAPAKKEAAKMDANAAKSTPKKSLPPPAAPPFVVPPLGGQKIPPKGGTTNTSPSLGKIMAIISVIAIALIGLFAWSPWSKTGSGVRPAADGRQDARPSQQTVGPSGAGILPAASSAKSGPDARVTLPAATAAQGKVIDLLALVDLNRDVVKGTWSKKPDGLSRDDAKDWGVCELPYEPPEEYDVEAEFTPMGNGYNVNFHIAGGGATFLWKINFYGQDPPVHGFDMLDGKPAQPAQPARGEAFVRNSLKLEAGKRYTTRVEVRRNGLHAFVNGEDFLRWSGDFKRFSTEPDAQLRNPRALGVSSAFRSVVFHRVTVREVTGTGKITGGARDAGILPAAANAKSGPEARDTLQSAATSGGWISLMDKIDPAADAVKGTWSRVAGGLQCVMATNGAGVLQLPYELPEEYDFRIAYAPPKGSEVMQILVARGHAFRWTAGVTTDHVALAGFDCINGRNFPRSGAASALPAQVVSNKSRESLVEVRRDGVIGYIDGIKRVQFKTDFTNMSIDPKFALRDAKRCGIGILDSKPTFTDISVRDVTGKGKLLR